MRRITANDKSTELMKRIGVVIICALTSAMSLNFFLIPAKVMSAGMNGVAQIIVALGAEHLGLHLSTGLFIFLLNIPVFALGFWKLGKDATIWSFVNVVAISLVTMIFPQGAVTDNILMNSLMGGVIVGIGAGLALKMGFTTGGMDILSLVLSKTTGNTVGKYMFILNGLIVVVAGFIFSWESALYTIICIYVMSYVVDMIHTSHQKLTVLIVTTKPDEVGKSISQRVFRGMTLLPSIGGYSGVESKTIMMVITRYELYDLEQAVLEADENAFVNMLATQSIIGRFATQDEQRTFTATGVFPEVRTQRKRR
ncbi:YitT family protein [Enterococcus asini ATCC 700915]|uniref:YitT family protein n=2 Tax=Enterococcus asini TaxID=57732 RepID=R2SG52_9ENTE|nr:YitT family protein [Enterococcus asini]EOH87174.1 YitT family protein [Enterococcus asini ATCC 700915]EOT58420.1 YitT family protein [Enterococcus asini ATCC 700915]MCD5029363.1 YitT family protein [Enterococcus asini]MDT2743620.1 YitT family protein [Enterococcus asini]MDT2764973.1 YitT family protein [Enterococcus asini]